ncbi:MAG: hypothetical protein NVSMB65_19970 [Chloroflexota bacterium]
MPMTGGLAMCYATERTWRRAAVRGAGRPRVWSVERWKAMGDKSPKNNQKQQSQKKAASSKKTTDSGKK